MIELSVIIPTRNRESLLAKFLSSLVNQSFSQEKFEVIVVDNGSNDKTMEVTENFRKYFENLQYLHDPTPGLHVGRHAGLKAAKGEILVYCDDDIQAFPTWLEGIAESFRMSEVMLVGGNNLPAYETKPPQWLKCLWRSTPWGKTLPYYSVLDFGKIKKEISPYYVWGCNFSIRKSILLELGGFHPDGMPSNLRRYRGDGETAVSKGVLAKGYKALFNPKASVYHWISTSRMSLHYLHTRAYMQGISDSYTHIRASGYVTPRLKITIVIRRLLSFLRPCFNKKDCLRRYYLRRALMGYWKGYLYHQNQVLTDPRLLKWVLKKNYLS